MIHLQVDAPPGLGNHILPQALEGTGVTIKGRGIITEVWMLEICFYQNLWELVFYVKSSK